MEPSQRIELVDDLTDLAQSAWGTSWASKAEAVRARILQLDDSQLASVADLLAERLDDAPQMPHAVRMVRPLLVPVDKSHLPADLRWGDPWVEGPMFHTSWKEWALQFKEHLPGLRAWQRRIINWQAADPAGAAHVARQREKDERRAEKGRRHYDRYGFSLSPFANRSLAVLVVALIVLVFWVANTTIPAVAKFRCAITLGTWYEIPAATRPPYGLCRH